MNNELVIKTAVKPRGPSLPSKRPGQLIYETVKYGLKSMGIYDEVRQYDPGYYIEKYRKRYAYKPRKRITGYALQTRGFLQKKDASTDRKFTKTCSGRSLISKHYQCR